MGSEANVPQGGSSLANGGSTDKKPEPSPSEPEQLAIDQQENMRDNDDDGGEMVEAGEDMVIY